MTEVYRDLSYQTDVCYYAAVVLVTRESAQGVVHEQYLVREGDVLILWILFFFSSRRRHTRFDCDWSSDVCSSDLMSLGPTPASSSAPTSISLSTLRWPVTRSRAYVN